MVTGGKNRLHWAKMGYRTLKQVTGNYKGLREVTRGYKRLQGVTRGEKKLQGVTSGYSGKNWLQRVTER